MIRLPARQTPFPQTLFPKPDAPNQRANAWGPQWKYLPRRAGTLLRTSVEGALRRIER